MSARGPGLGGRWSGSTVPGNRWDLAPRGRGEPARVSVVVSHFEQPTQLRRTLAALAGQTHAADHLEVVVTDDGSATAPVVPAGVRLVTQPDAGFRVARARNRGAAAASGDVLVFVDADTTPEPGFVGAISRLPAVLPEAVVVGRRRHADLAGLDPDGRRGDAVADLALGSDLGEPAWLADAWSRSRDLLDADELSFRHVLGSVLACSTRLFWETGGFDDGFERYGGEDWEWAHRAWTHGAVLAHEPRAVAWHDGPDRAQRPGWGSDEVGRARMLAETLTVGRRVPVPGVAPRGLATGSADPVVTLDPAIDGDALVVTLDGLLAAFPRARVLLEPGRVVPDLVDADPRVRRCDLDAVTAAGGPDAPGAWRVLHVERAVRGDHAAWTASAALLCGPGAAGRVRVTDADGAPALTWTLVRAERRRRRWGEAAGFADRAEPGALRAVAGDVSLAGAWGGWQ